MGKKIGEFLFHEGAKENKAQRVAKTQI